ncbi:hypothetical protein CPB86DRAFT_713973, partial [Serendipita vermifera]
MSSDAAIVTSLAQISPATAENFPLWRWTVRTQFITGGIWATVLQPDAQGNYPQEPAPANPTAPTAAETAAIVSFRAARAKAANWLVVAAGTANQDITDTHQATSDATTMWDALVARYERQDPGSRFRTMFRLLQTLKKPGDSWSDYCIKLDSEGHHLLNLIPTNFDRVRFVAELKLFALLSSFPAQDPTRNTLVVDQNLTWESARNAVERLQSTLPSGTAPDSATMAETAAATTTANKKITCNFCKYTGHPIVECRIAKIYSTLFQKERSEGIWRDADGNITTTPRPANLSGNRGSTNTRHRREHVRNADEEASEVETAGNASLSSPLTNTSTDTWTADSGASKHMTFR